MFPNYVPALAIILFAHWLFDFKLQNRWMADNKHSVFRTRLGTAALTSHVAIVTAGVASAALIINQFISNKSPGAWDGYRAVLLFVAINAAAHFVTDAITSQFTGYFWKKATDRLDATTFRFKGDLNGFFSMIGFDQFLHGLVYVATLPLLI